MTAPNEDSSRGLALAVAAYLMWGFLPLYMKVLAHVPPTEVIAHRVIWSVPIAALILLAMWRTADIRAALSSPRTLGMAAVTAVLLIVYATGAKLLRLSTIGILQYIAPTMIFLTAVLVFGEPFGMYRFSDCGFVKRVSG
jgi:EamA domain-containing membrane protein RarD